MNEDCKEFIRLFQSHHVEFLIVGAHALAFYGWPRYTKDVDLWVRRTPENAGKIAAAIREFGLTLDESATKALIEDRKIIRLGAPPNMVDVLNFLDGASFDEAWERRKEGQLDDLKVHFISVSDLRASKEAAGREQDLADLKRLEGIE